MTSTVRLIITKCPVDCLISMRNDRGVDLRDYVRHRKRRIVTRRQQCHIRANNCNSRLDFRIDRVRMSVSPLDWMHVRRSSPFVHFYPRCARIYTFNELSSYADAPLSRVNASISHIMSADGRDEVAI